MLEPIPLQNYRCPVCKTVLLCETIKEARDHVNIPVDEPLPANLIFKHSCAGLDVILIVKRDRSITDQHDFRQDLIGYSSLDSPKNDRSDWCNSKELKQRFKEGYNLLLTPEEFEYFIGDASRKLDLKRYNIPIEALIRTTPELEALVAEAVR